MATIKISFGFDESFELSFQDGQFRETSGKSVITLVSTFTDGKIRGWVLVCKSLPNVWWVYNPMKEFDDGSCYRRIEKIGAKYVVNNFSILFPDEIVEQLDDCFRNMTRQNSGSYDESLSDLPKKYIWCLDRELDQDQFAD